MAELSVLEQMCWRALRANTARQDARANSRREDSERDSIPAAVRPPPSTLKRRLIVSVVSMVIYFPGRAAAAAKFVPPVPGTPVSAGCSFSASAPPSFVYLPASRAPCPESGTRAPRRCQTPCRRRAPPRACGSECSCVSLVLRSPAVSLRCMEWVARVEIGGTRRWRK